MHGLFAALLNSGDYRIPKKILEKGTFNVCISSSGGAFDIGILNENAEVVCVISLPQYLVRDLIKEYTTLTLLTLQGKKGFDSLTKELTSINKDRYTSENDTATYFGGPKPDSNVPQLQSGRLVGNPFPDDSTFQWPTTTKPTSLPIMWKSSSLRRGNVRFPDIFDDTDIKTDSPTNIRDGDE